MSSLADWTREDLIDYCKQTNCRECDSKVKAFCDSLCDNLTLSPLMSNMLDLRDLK